MLLDTSDQEEVSFTKDDRVEVLFAGSRTPWKEAVVISVNDKSGMVVRKPMGSQARWEDTTIPLSDVSTRIRYRHPTTPSTPQPSDSNRATIRIVPSGEKRRLEEFNCPCCEAQFTMPKELVHHLITDHVQDQSPTGCLVDLIIKEGDPDEALRLLAKSVATSGDWKAIEHVGQCVQRKRFTRLGEGEARITAVNALGAFAAGVAHSSDSPFIIPYGGGHVPQPIYGQAGLSSMLNAEEQTILTSCLERQESENGTHDSDGFSPPTPTPTPIPHLLLNIDPLRRIAD